jgi:hypothetical protein
LQNKVLENKRSSVSTIRRREKKKHRSLKQIFVLSLDALRKKGKICANDVDGCRRWSFDGSN